jgi:hypothetical protein
MQWRAVGCEFNAMLITDGHARTTTISSVYCASCSNHAKQARIKIRCLQYGEELTYCYGESYWSPSLRRLEQASLEKNQQVYAVAKALRLQA